MNGRVNMAAIEMKRAIREMSGKWKYPGYESDSPSCFVLSHPAAMMDCPLLKALLILLLVGFSRELKHDGL